MGITFVTYGDKIFAKSRERIGKEALALGFFDKVIVETENLKKEHLFDEAVKASSDFKKINTKRRGGGYWLWKPYVIYKHLQNIQENDTLFWVDAGCTLPNDDTVKEKLREYLDRVNKSNLGVLTFRNPFLESVWTKGDVFDYFNASCDEAIYGTRQISTGRIILKKCDHSLKLVKKWWETAKENPKLFDDSPSRVKNFDGFKENRHEQSVWSILCKTIGAECDYNWYENPIMITRIRG